MDQLTNAQEIFEIGMFLEVLKNQKLGFDVAIERKLGLEPDRTAFRNCYQALVSS